MNLNLVMHEKISPLSKSHIISLNDDNLAKQKCKNRVYPLTMIQFPFFSLVTTGFYTSALVIPTLLGFLQFLVGGEVTPFFCCFYVIWMTVFLEIWKRKCSVMAYEWGTLSLATLELPRTDYYGTLERDPITGKMTPQYPVWKTQLQVYLVSIPVILACIICAVIMTISQFLFEDYLIEKFGIESYITLLPSIFQSIFVAILTVFYDRFATFLTIKENHRTQNQYERHRVNKLIVLEFVNNFFCLFYIAFIKRDMKMLQNQLMTQMLILQVRWQSISVQCTLYILPLHSLFLYSLFKMPRSSCYPN